MLLLLVLSKTKREWGATMEHDLLLLCWSQAKRKMWTNDLDLE